MKTIHTLKWLLALPGRLLGFAWTVLARVAYLDYGATTGFKNFRGEPMPGWNNLPDSIRAAWCAAARTVFLIGLALGLILGGAGVLLHLYTHRPAEPEARVVERVVTKTVEVEKVVKVEAKQAAQVQRVVIYRDRTVTPEGAVHEREAETSEIASVEREDTASVLDRRVEAEQASERIVDPRRDWRAGVLVGVQSITDWRPVYGLHVERRVVGDLYLGVWGLNSGAVGASVSVAF